MSGDRRTRQRTRKRVVGTESASTTVRSGREVVDERESTETTQHSVVGEPARVRVEGSVTQNMGDFNSVRVSVAIERPCANTDDAIDETYQEVSDQVDAYLERELDLATNGEEQ